ncbi:MAG: NADH-quinone oxidoreductase subunit C [bacterium]|nr:NADH-quinone oxidoreductase subunit C [bacterium]
MTAEEIFAKLKDKFGDKVLETDTEVVQPIATIEAGSIVDVCEFLKNDPDLDFKFLNCITGVHVNKVEEEEEEKLRVVYNMEKIQPLDQKHKIALDVIVPISKPNVPSVTSVWKTADWHERETYDLIGIVFDGHPDMTRILCPEDWEGHPLRKDYVVQEFYRGMKVPYPGEEPKPEEKEEK